MEKNTLQQINTKKRHNLNIDILRCIAMMMVVVLHYFGKGELLPDLSKSEDWNATSLTALGIESVCCVAVNVYMLISGYVLSESSFKFSRLIKLYLQVWFYSFFVGMIAIALGIAEGMTTYDYLFLIFPVSMEHYWFMTAYIFLYLLLPILLIAIRKFSKEQLGFVIIMLVIVHSLVKSVLPVRLETDRYGYDFLWYLILFLIAAYIRKYKPTFINKKSSIAMIVIGVVGVFAEALVIGKIINVTGRLTFIENISFEYNHIFPLLASVGLFSICTLGSDGSASNVNKNNGIFSKVVFGVAPYTLGVYLLHENTTIRYVWPKWLGADKISGPLSLVLYTLMAMILVFVIGVLIDFLRSLLFKGLNKLLYLVKPYRKLVNQIYKVDRMFLERKGND